MRNKFLLGAAAVALIAPVSVMAQETTAALRGTITLNGQGVAGATVVAVETTSGSRSSATTGTDGAFSFSGLRPGGPYTVTVTSPSGNKTITDIFTVVQQPYDLPIELADTAAGSGTGADIVVTASRVAGAGVRSDGPQSIFTQADVAKVASVNRDVRDIERRDPFATIDLSNTGDRGGAVSFAGVNPRYNKFTINGVTVGDTFGLNQDASPTNRGPVPFDSIGQFSVSIAPYDFRQSGFQGGVIDAILASGTNTFHGTGFYSENTDGLSGSRIGSNVITNPKFNSKTYGATLSGPLIKDRLFFMVSAEKNEDPRPFSTVLFQIPALGQAQVDALNAITASTYPAVKPGNTLVVNPRKDEKIVGRIDANITDQQKLSISYINSYDVLVSQNNTSTSTSSPSYGLSSNAYALTELLRAGIVQLNSQWTDKFSTEARGIYKKTVRGQEPLLGRGSGQFGVCEDIASVGAIGTGAASSCSTSVPRVFFGPDNSRQTNQLNFDTIEGSLLGRYRAGDHEVKALVDVTQNHTYNNFVQNSLGSWYFDSLADYRAGNANQLVYAAAIAPAAANFRYTTIAFGLQDDWQVTPNLTITYGARETLYAERGNPVFNPAFDARNGYSNTKTYKGLELFEPRLSFSYRGEGRFAHLNLRGGGGIFGGGTPDIYLSNSYSNTVTINSLTINRDATCNTPGTPCALALNGVTGNIPAALAAYASGATNATTLQRTNTGALDPNFRIPREVKATLSADYTFAGIDFGADYYFSKTIYGVVFTDARSIRTGTLPDGRPRYNGYYGFTDNNYDIITRNSTRGRSHVGVIRADKKFGFGLDVGGSYTLADVRDVGDATSSTINSNYRYQLFSDPDNAVLGTSDNQTRWEFKYNIGFDHAFFRDYKTIIQLFGDTKAGRPFSYTMLDNTTTRSSVFGTVLTGQGYATNLLYVPTGAGDPLVTYDSPATQQALDGYINGSVLKKYRGQIAPKNIDRNRANTRIDLHLEQQIPTFVGGSRITLFAEILNVPNLLNSKWGGLRQLGFPYTAPLVNVQCLTTAGNAIGAGTAATTSAQPCAQYRYSSFTNPNTAAVNITQSLYAIRLGARFTF
ncbi:TonB-dependent receptor [Sphingomonas bacterium]|uniref:TonB-dependent receptor n=1 Tax=Sphingomonas bacterium TaxID=1895847 RepID=UPI00157591FD|nr:TonB-dependent receptor [Sphingomonas bacterium]